MLINHYFSHFAEFEIQISKSKIPSLDFIIGELTDSLCYFLYCRTFKQTKKTRTAIFMKQPKCLRISNTTNIW
jgi:hypothetical protein